MIPIVNDLTVGMAMEQYHHECRRPRGVYLSIDHPDAIEEAFANFGAGPGDIDLILATDAEQILGIGDWGVGGIEVSIGKLAIYTAAGGIDPTRVIPVMLDVGTNRESLLNDPDYIGNRHARIRGERYDAFIDAYVEVVTGCFPTRCCSGKTLRRATGGAFSRNTATSICTFNDDMQGTGAITLAAAISAVRVCGTPLRNQRVVIFGAGTAGIGIADQIRDAMVREGLSKEDATRRFWCVDRQGLLTADMAGQLRRVSGAAMPAPLPKARAWKHDGNGNGMSLAEVVRRVKPTMLIGASTVAGSFTEAIVKEMAAHTERPIIFALCIPPARAAANPADLIAWTDGRALIATGSSFAPVTSKGVTYVIGQVNNAMLYPGLALGAIVSRASRISDGMFAAAANAVSSLVAVRQPGASLLPQIDDLRSVSATVAVAVAEAAMAEGLARRQVRRHRATGAGRDVAAGVSRDPGVLEWYLAFAVIDILPGVALLPGFAPGAEPQAASPPERFFRISVNVDLVVLQATVRDRNGRYRLRSARAGFRGLRRSASGNPSVCSGTKTFRSPWDW